MKTDLVQIHHADYQEDIPFWVSLVRDRDPVLEVGCGHGRVTLPLVDSGCQVVGVDLDPVALDWLRESVGQLSAQARKQITLVEGDILDFQTEELFGAVIIHCNTISTFSPSSRRALFQQAHSILADGGLFAASLPNPVEMFTQLAELEGEDELGEADWEASLIHPESGYPIEVSSRISAVDGEPNGLRWDWIYDQLAPDGGVKREIVSTVHFPALPETLLAELAEAGFSKTVLLGDFDRSQFQVDSPYLILISKK